MTIISYYNGSSFNHTCDIYPIAKHFFELGLRAQKGGIDMKRKIIKRPFNEIFSQEEIDVVDKKILEAQEKERKRLEEAWVKVKDFPMNN